MTKPLNTAQLDRACGVLLGAAVGDALGAGYEFGSATVGADGPRMIGGGLGGFAPGEWTDDTTMTWAIADVAAAGADLWSEEALTAIARRFREWYDTGPADIGIQTSQVLREAGEKPTGEQMTAVARRLHERTGHTGGNGSLMRTSAVALAHWDDPEALVKAAMRVSALTHYDPDALEACALWSLAIRHAVLFNELDLRAGIAYLHPDSRQTWSDRIDEAERSAPARFTPNGYVVTALQAAWSAISHTPVPESAPSRHLSDSLDTAIRIGNDTDTVASIAGALLGARWGASAVPAAWRRIVHGYPGLSAEDLVHLGHLTANHGARHRGWPLTNRIDYGWEDTDRALVRHPHDDRVWLSGVSALDNLPDDVSAVVSLCLTGRTQVPEEVAQVGFRLIDSPDPAANPNLDFVLDDAAHTVAALREEGHTVLLHCVAAHSRTPTVAIRYAHLLGVEPATAYDDVVAALPRAHPNAAFQAALERLGRGGASA